MIIGFTCGAFDLFHAGHNIFLRDAKRHCDHLIVGLHTDPTIDRPEKNKPIQTIYERYVQLKNCSWVDDIIPYDTEADLLNLLATNTINVRFLGSDYVDKTFTGDKLCEALNIRIIYLLRYHTFSSSELRSRIAHSSV
jgi:glycerol-3-phosphate cytidylyltransferase